VRIVEISLDGVNLLLERDTAGSGNWQSAGPDERAPPTSAGDTARLPPKVVMIDSVIALRNQRDGRVRTLAVKRLDATTASPGDPVAPAFDGSAISATGTIGPLLRPGEPVWLLSVAVAGSAFGLAFEVAGQIAEPAVGAGLDLKIIAARPDVATLDPLVGEGLPRGMPVQIVTRVNGTMQALDVTGLNLTLGSIAVTGNLSAALDAPRPRLAGALQAATIDLAPFLGDAEAAASVTPPGRVFPGDPLPFEGLRVLDVALNIQVGSVAVGRRTLRDAAAEIALSDGALQVRLLRGTLLGAGLDGALTVVPGQAPGVHLVAMARGLDVAQVLAESGDVAPVGVRADIELDPAGSGTSIAAVLATSSGTARFLMGPGRARTQGLETLVGGVGALLGTLTSGGGEWTRVNCAASDFAIRDGVAESQVLLVDGQYSTLVGEGQVDLASEALDLRLTPNAKQVTLNVAVPVRVQGTLATPAFQPDELGVVRKLGGIVGVVLFPPAALLWLGELGSGGDNACLELAAGGSAARRAGSGCHGSGGRRGRRRQARRA